MPASTIAIATAVLSLMHLRGTKSPTLDVPRFLLTPATLPAQSYKMTTRTCVPSVSYTKNE